MMNAAKGPARRGGGGSKYSSVSARTPLYVSLRMTRSQTTRKVIALAAKRAIDLGVAGSALLVLAPVLAVMAAVVRRSMGAPVLFRQERPGLRGSPFDVLKFRSMRDARDERGRLLPDSERLTGVGRFLRASSLDELPQLWNVVRGDLSLVGPRPLLMQYLERYSPEQARRHDVKPGITGWAQVNGRNAISWGEKFALDVWYVDHWSLWLDLKILALTALKVSKRDGIAQQGHVTMSEFMGSETAPERARE
jgi:sugar transferase EpsL